MAMTSFGGLSSSCTRTSIGAAAVLNHVFTFSLPYSDQTIQKWPHVSPLSFHTKHCATVTRRCSSSSPLSQAPIQQLGQLQLEDCLERTWLALGLHTFLPQEHFVVTGRQVHFGMEGDWRLAWSTDGRFHERYSGTEMAYEQGYDGENNPWYADSGGRVSTAELDDMEIGLLVSWVRIGYWLTKEGRNKLVILLEKGDHNLSGHLVREIQLSIRLKNRKVVSYVTIDANTWLPLRIESRCVGSIDKWEFMDWQYILPGRKLKFPKISIHFPPSGGKGSSTMINASMDCTNDIYLLPNSKLVPRYNQNYPRGHIDMTCASSVKLIRAESGHFLVRPLINGSDIGYFMIDTGASGLVISPDKAKEVGMDTFGEVYATGIEGKFKSRFCRGKSLQLGPLTIIDPIFLEAPMEGLIKEFSSEVVGICGYDIFYYCVVEISTTEGRLSLFDPLHYIPPNSVNWQKMYMLGNVPHIEAKFNNQNAIFLLDTGAGGVDVLFHKRAVDEFKLLSRSQWVGCADVSGMGNSSTQIKVQSGMLERLEVGSHVFNPVKVLFFKDDGMLDLSVYTAGILCGDILAHYLAIFDYSNQKFALVRT